MPEDEVKLISTKKCASCGVLVSSEKEYCPVCLSSVFLPSKARLSGDRPPTKKELDEAGL